jgi:hypothetical protein
MYWIHRQYELVNQASPPEIPAITYNYYKAKPSLSALTFTGYYSKKVPLAVGHFRIK